MDFCYFCLTPFKRNRNKKFCTPECCKNWHNNPLKLKRQPQAILLRDLTYELKRLREEKKEARRKEIFRMQCKYRNVKIGCDDENESFRIYFNLMFNYEDK